MKRILPVIVALTSSLQLFAQTSPGGPSTVKSGFAQVNNGHIYGKITDSQGKAINEASVLVLQNKFDTLSKKSKEILVKGVSTAANGDFDIDELPVVGKLKLKISAMGYKEMDQSISFMPGMPSPQKPAGGANSAEKDLGKIKLTSTVKELDAVTVTAVKSLMKLDIDKKVFNVEKNIVSEGGTAVDVMKNVPSVNVDLDGNVTLRNSAPQIFVDGRPTTLTLDQIPANAIESVEVMTNPSAKYDASGGGAGILNIVLKKNKKSGYNGNVRAGINKYGEKDAGVDFNIRQNKINFTGGINARQANGRSTGTVSRTNITDTPVTTINQQSFEQNKGNMLFGRVGLDYFVTNKTTLSLSAMKMHGDIKPNSLLYINTDSLYNTGNATSYSQRNTSGERIFNGQGLVFGMKHLFAKEGEELTADANYFTGKSTNSSLYTTDNYVA